MEKEKFIKEFSEDLLATWAKNSFGIEIKANEKALFKEFCIDVILGNLSSLDKFEAIYKERPRKKDLQKRWLEIHSCNNNWFQNIYPKLRNIENIRKKTSIKREKQIIQRYFYLSTPVDYYKWYFEQEAKCYYCGVTEIDMRKYFEENQTRGGRRGINFELDRLVADGKYNIENCKLTCYLCNNAKSNFLTKEQFEIIANKGIKEFWKQEK